MLAFFLRREAITATGGISRLSHLLNKKEFPAAWTALVLQDMLYHHPESEQCEWYGQSGPLAATLNIGHRQCRYRQKGKEDGQEKPAGVSDMGQSAANILSRFFFTHEDSSKIRSAFRDIGQPIPVVLCQPGGR